MASLVWDQVGERVYQAGIDRGVLYLHDAPAVVWNGLIDVEESTGIEVKSFYLDGVKYLENLTPGEFSGKLKAFTYPKEFDSVNGIADVSPGLSYYEQPSKSFDLSYRTKIGNDLLGEDYGYKIHILYNVFANPDTHTFNTLNDSVEATEFSWNLSGTPPKIPRYRPTIHLTIDSRTTPPDLLKTVEDILYGTDTSSPYLPSIEEITVILGGIIGALIIIDHGDGTWSAIDESGGYITMLDGTTFMIENADATYLDANTYEISSTNVGEVG
jgi:hypothetical protein